jgi:hypothetical protein
VRLTPDGFTTLSSLVFTTIFGDLNISVHVDRQTGILDDRRTEAVA